MKRKLIPSVALAAAMILPAVSGAAPSPIPAIELDRGNFSQPVPFAEPDGSQLVTWNGQAADVGVFLAERGAAGGAFAQPVQLSSTSNAEPPSISFTPDGGLYAIWGIATNGVSAQTTTRPPNGLFAPVQSLTGCHRFVDSAAGPQGGIATACQFGLSTDPPNTVRWGSRPTLGPVAVGEDLTPPAYSPFLTPSIEWGPDGTIAIVSEGETTTSDPPPTNETTRVRVSIRGDAPFYTEDIALVTRPQEVSADSPLVLSDGTVAVPLDGSAGARVMIRPPGAATVFAPNPLQGNGVWGAGLDSDQNIHIATGISDDREYWSFVRPPGGSFGGANPIPLPVIPGNGDAFLTGFEVAPDGTEYAIIHGDDGTYVSSRSPGQAFASPVRIGDVSSGNPDSVTTRDGDLLVAWDHENGPGDDSIKLGGLDNTPPKVTIGSFPETVADGQAADFSATATDAMGIDSLEWNFDGTVVSGGDASHRFVGAGPHEVSFTATDVAGQKTVVRRTVEVPIGPNSTPVMTLKTPKRIKFRAFGKRGLRIVVTGQPRVKIRAILGTSKRNAGKRPLATRTVRSFKSRHVLRIKPRRSRLGKRRSFRLFVQVKGTTEAGRQATRSRTVKVRR